MHEGYIRPFDSIFVFVVFFVHIGEKFGELVSFVLCVNEMCKWYGFLREVGLFIEI